VYETPGYEQVRVRNVWHPRIPFRCRQLSAKSASDRVYVISVGKVKWHSSHFHSPTTGNVRLPQQKPTIRWIKYRRWCLTGILK